MQIFSPGERLLKVIEFIGETNGIIDVGSDHGKLPAWLLLNGKIKTAYASDISSASVEKINSIAHHFGLEDRLKGIMCDGLSAFSGSEADTVTICGMGGDTIVHILSEAPWISDENHRIILQCMSSFESLNLFLHKSRLEIINEAVVKESGRLYDILMLKGKEGHKNPEISVPSKHILSDKFAPEYIKRLIRIKQSELDGMLRKSALPAESVRTARQYLDYYGSLYGTNSN